MKHCPRCEEDLSLSEFGVALSRNDKLNLYCKRCVREKMALHRQQVAVSNAVRKPMVFAKQMPKDLKTRIKWAIRIRHAETREAIQRATKIRWDALCDLLAEMTFDDNELLLDAKAGRFTLAA